MFVLNPQPLDGAPSASVRLSHAFSSAKELICIKSGKILLIYKNFILSSNNQNVNNWHLTFTKQGVQDFILFWPHNSCEASQIETCGKLWESSWPSASHSLQWTYIVSYGVLDGIPCPSQKISQLHILLLINQHCANWPLVPEQNYWL